LKYKTKKQFEIAYEVVVATAKMCEEMELKKMIEKKIMEEIMKNANKEGRP
jgi:hypothetical protein